MARHRLRPRRSGDLDEAGLGQYGQAPVRESADTPALHAAFDRLAGAGRWVPRGTLGTFPVRFPHAEEPGDAGWHIDVSFAGDGDPADFFTWRANVCSRGRALLMLFLFCDIGEADAPTRIRVGSHRAVARLLAPEGERGLSLMKISKRLGATAHCRRRWRSARPAPSI